MATNFMAIEKYRNDTGVCVCVERAERMLNIWLFMAQSILIIAQNRTSLLLIF